MFYLFCRVHRNELPVRTRRLMSARHVALEVVAPRSYYRGFDGWSFVAEISKKLTRFAKSKIDEALSMSPRVLAFPRTFDRIPFRDGKDACLKCAQGALTDEARAVREAFGALAPPRLAP